MEIRRYSIRKLTVGAASVLIGLSFLGINTNQVKADTLNNDQEIQNATKNKFELEKNADKDAQKITANKSDKKLENVQNNNEKKTASQDIELSNNDQKQVEKAPTQSITSANKSSEDKNADNKFSDKNNDAEVIIDAALSKNALDAKNRTTELTVSMTNVKAGDKIQVEVPKSFATASHPALTNLTSSLGNTTVDNNSDNDEYDITNKFLNDSFGTATQRIVLNPEKSYMKDLVLDDLGTKEKEIVIKYNDKVAQTIKFTNTINPTFKLDKDNQKTELPLLSENKDTPDKVKESNFVIKDELDGTTLNDQHDTIFEKSDSNIVHADLDIEVPDSFNVDLQKTLNKLASNKSSFKNVNVKINENHVLMQGDTNISDLGALGQIDGLFTIAKTQDIKKDKTYSGLKVSGSVEVNGKTYCLQDTYKWDLTRKEPAKPSDFVPKENISVSVSPAYNKSENKLNSQYNTESRLFKGLKDGNTIEGVYVPKNASDRKEHKISGDVTADHNFILNSVNVNYSVDVADSGSEESEKAKEASKKVINKIKEHTAASLHVDFKGNQDIDALSSNGLQGQNAVVTYADGSQANIKFDYMGAAKLDSSKKISKLDISLNKDWIKTYMLGSVVKSDGSYAPTFGHVLNMDIYGAPSKDAKLGDALNVDAIFSVFDNDQKVPEFRQESTQKQYVIDPKRMFTSQIDNSYQSPYKYNLGDKEAVTKENNLKEVVYLLKKTDDGQFEYSPTTNSTYNFDIYNQSLFKDPVIYVVNPKTVNTTYWDSNKSFPDGEDIDGVNVKSAWKNATVENKDVNGKTITIYQLKGDYPASKIENLTQLLGDLAMDLPNSQDSGRVFISAKNAKDIFENIKNVNSTNFQTYLPKDIQYVGDLGDFSAEIRAVTGVFVTHQVKGNESIGFSVEGKQNELSKDQQMSYISSLANATEDDLTDVVIVNNLPTITNGEMGMEFDGSTPVVIDPVTGERLQAQVLYSDQIADTDPHTKVDLTNYKYASSISDWTKIKSFVVKLDNIAAGHAARITLNGINPYIRKQSFAPNSGTEYGYTSGQSWADNLLPVTIKPESSASAKVKYHVNPTIHQRLHYVDTEGKDQYIELEDLKNVNDIGKIDPSRIPENYHLVPNSAHSINGSQTWAQDAKNQTLNLKELSNGKLYYYDDDDVIQYEVEHDLQLQYRFRYRDDNGKYAYTDAKDLNMLHLKPGDYLPGQDVQVPIELGKRKYSILSIDNNYPILLIRKNETSKKLTIPNFSYNISNYKLDKNDNHAILQFDLVRQIHMRRFIHWTDDEGRDQYIEVQGIDAIPYEKVSDNLSEIEGADLVSQWGQDYFNDLLVNEEDIPKLPKDMRIKEGVAKIENGPKTWKDDRENKTFSLNDERIQYYDDGDKLFYDLVPNDAKLKVKFIDVTDPAKPVYLSEDEYEGKFGEDFSIDPSLNRTQYLTKKYNDYIDRGYVDASNLSQTFMHILVPNISQDDMVYLQLMNGVNNLIFSDGQPYLNNGDVKFGGFDYAKASSSMTFDSNLTNKEKKDLLSTVYVLLSKDKPDEDYITSVNIGFIPQLHPLGQTPDLTNKPLVDSIAQDFTDSDGNHTINSVLWNNYNSSINISIDTLKDKDGNTHYRLNPENLSNGSGILASNSSSPMQIQHQVLQTLDHFIVKFSGNSFALNQSTSDGNTFIPWQQAFGYKDDDFDRPYITNSDITLDIDLNKLVSGAWDSLTYDQQIQLLQKALTINSKPLTNKNGDLLSEENNPIGSPGFVYNWYYDQNKKVNDSKQITETIHFKDENGKKIKDDHLAPEITLNRTGVKRLSDGHIDWNSWNQDEFAEYPAPDIDGYIKKQEKIDKVPVDGSKDHYDFTLVYAPKKQETGIPDSFDKPEGHIGIPGVPTTTDKPEFPIGVPGVPTTTDKPEFPIGVPGVPTTTDKPEFPIGVPGVPTTTDKPEFPIGVPGVPTTTDKPKFPIGVPSVPTTTDKPKFPIGIPGVPTTMDKPKFPIDTPGKDSHIPDGNGPTNSQPPTTEENKPKDPEVPTSEKTSNSNVPEEPKKLITDNIKETNEAISVVYPTKEVNRIKDTLKQRTTIHKPVNVNKKTTLPQTGSNNSKLLITGILTSLVGLGGLMFNLKKKR